MSRHFKANQPAPRGYVYQWGDTRACRYCGKPVEVRDVSEGNAPDLSLGFDHFFECWHSAKPDGRYVVICNQRAEDVHNNVKPRGEELLAFDNMLRATDEMERYAGWNTTRNVFVVIDRQQDNAFVAAMRGIIRL